MINLKNVTLYGADTIDLNRLLNIFAICEDNAIFGSKKIFTKIEKDFVTNTGIEVINTEYINNIKDYNNFNLKHLNDYIETDFVMVVEHDGFILNTDAWSPEFLNYDFIGAPMAVEGKLVVGNGGFSIRSKKLLEITQTDEFIQLGDKVNHIFAENDDWTISVIKRQYLENKGIKFAPVELAHKFSFEKNKIYGNKWDGQFGFHGLSRTDISEWIKENPKWGIENNLN